MLIFKQNFYFIFLPQLLQNFAFALFLVPQISQYTSNLQPQLLQNFALSELALPQILHVILGRKDLFSSLSYIVIKSENDESKLLLFEINLFPIAIKGIETKNKKNFFGISNVENEIKKSIKAININKMPIEIKIFPNVLYVFLSLSLLFILFTYNLSPQFLQNLESSELIVLHFSHSFDKFLPQLIQNLVSLSFSFPQILQIFFSFSNFV